uniref:K Homology domain-containing protein n=1 Tax=Schistocephalus solidus TaxID=70667 RepID=A0A0X3P756_SCHSO
MDIHELQNFQFDDSVTEICPETNRNLRKFLQAARIENMFLKDGRPITDPEVWNEISKEVLIPSLADEHGRTISLSEACLSGDEEAVKLFLSSGECDVNEIGIDGETVLACAVSKNAVPIVELLLQRGADPNPKEKKVESVPLIEAAKDGHTDVVRLLLQYGASVSQVSNNGYTALHYAATNGHLDCVRLLLQYKSPLEVQNENGHTPLMEAASNGHIEVARCLIEHGAYINTYSTEFKESALTLASYKGHADMVNFLLENGADHEHRTDEMHTPLMEAAMEGHVEVARLLLAHGANVNIPQDSFESPLTLAACGGHTELAHLLLGYEADIEEVNDEGYTPLMEAAREGHEETVALLLAAGADVNAKTDETQETALTLAACGGFIEVCDMLLNSNADIEVGSAGCSTPLMEAAQEGHLELVRRLLQRGANVNAMTATGDTALHYAAENGHVKVCKELLNWRAVFGALVEGCKTPLMKAARAGHLEVVQLFVEWGVPVNQTTSRNDATALSLACNGGHINVVEYLLKHGADPQHQLSDGCTMLIEAARSGSPSVMRLILDFPKSLSQSLVPPSLPQSNQQLTVQQIHNGPSVNTVGMMPPPLPVGATANGVLDQLVVGPIHGTGHPSAAAVETVRQALNTQQAPSRLNAALANAYAVGWAAGAAAYAQQPQQQQQNQATTVSVSAEVHSCGSSGSVTASSAQGATHQQNQQGLPQKGMRFSQTPGTRGLLPKNSELTAAGDSADSAPTNLKSGEKTSALVEAYQSQPAVDSSSMGSTCPSSSMYTDELGSELLALFQELMPDLKADKAELLRRIEAMMCPRASRSPVGHHQTNACSIVNTSFETAALRHLVKQQKLFQQTDAVAHGDSASVDTAVVEFPQGTENLFSPPPPPPPSDLNQWDAFSPLHEGFTGGPIDYTSVAAGDANLSLAGTEGAEESVNKKQFSAIGSNSSASSSSSSTTECSSSASSAFSISTQLVDASAPYNYVRPLPLSKINRDQPVISEAYKAALSSVAPTNPSVPQGLPSNELVASEALGTYRRYQVSSKFTCPIEAARSLAQAIVSSGCQQQQQLAPAHCATTSMQATAPGSAGLTDRNSLHLLVPQPPVAPCVSSAYDELLNQQQPPPAIQIPQTMITTPTLAPPPSFPSLFSGSTPLTKPTTTAAAALTVGPTAVGDASVVPMNLPLPSSPCLAPNILPTAGVLPSEVGAATTGAAAVTSISPSPPQVDINACIESSMESALTLACNGGFVDLARLLLERGADKEHRDKKSYTPLHTAVYANQRQIVSLLLDYGADIEAQVERTKDTALSIACSHGRLEIAEELLNRGANKEHRNFSDYTPLSLAASGGFVDVIQLLLRHGAEINSRTGSKLGISPLMLASMNGFTAAVRVLLEHGSDINAQIETNRNTALTLACFQGQHEVVQLLVERKANIEHRAKTGLTPLMEAASGNHVKVGKILLDHGADVNALPVLSSRDTALTIAADKGRTEFVKLLLERGAIVEARNKKGATSLWLACNGGHLEVVQSLIDAHADVNSQDNRKVSCLMAAFRKGHISVVNVLVQHVTQFPSDKDCLRHIKSISADKELADRCQQCRKVIAAAKEKQEGEARKNADFLLEQIEQEEEERANKEAMQARKRERKRNKRKAKLEKEKKDKGSEENAASIERAPAESEALVDTEKARDADSKEESKDVSRGDAPPTSLANIVRSAAHTITAGLAASDSAPVHNFLTDIESSASQRREPEAKEAPEPQDSSSTFSRRSRKEAPVPASSTTEPEASVPTSATDLTLQAEATAAAAAAAVTEAKREKHRNKKQSQRAHKRSENTADLHHHQQQQPQHKAAEVSPLSISSAQRSVFYDPGFYTDIPVGDDKGWESVFDSPPHHSNDSNSWFVVQPASSSRSHRSANVPSSNTGTVQDTTDWKTSTGGNLSKRKLAIPVSKHDIGKIIGQGGAVVSALRNMSGIQIDIESARGEEVTERMVYLKGPSEIVQRTYDTIQDLLSGAVAGNDVIAKYASMKKSTQSTSTGAIATRLGGKSSTRKPSATSGTKTASSASTASRSAAATAPQPLLAAKLTASSVIVPLCATMKPSPNTNNNNTSSGLALSSGKTTVGSSWSVKQPVAAGQKGNFAAVAAAGVVSSQPKEATSAKSKHKGSLASALTTTAPSVAQVASAAGPAHAPVSLWSISASTHLSTPTFITPPSDSKSQQPLLDEQSFPPLSTSTLSKAVTTTTNSFESEQVPTPTYEQSNLLPTSKNDLLLQQQQQQMAPQPLVFTVTSTAPGVGPSAGQEPDQALQFQRTRQPSMQSGVAVGSAAVGAAVAANPTSSALKTSTDAMLMFAKPTTSRINSIDTPTSSSSRTFARAPGSERSAHRNATSAASSNPPPASLSAVTGLPTLAPSIVSCLSDPGGVVVTPTKRIAQPQISSTASSLASSNSVYPTGTTLTSSINTTWHSTAVSAPISSSRGKGDISQSIPEGNMSGESRFSSAVTAGAARIDADPSSAALSQFATSAARSNLDALFAQQRAVNGQFMNQPPLSSTAMWAGSQAPGDLGATFQQSGYEYSPSAEGLLSKSLYAGSSSQNPAQSSSQNYMLFQGRGYDTSMPPTDAISAEMFPPHIQSSYRLAHNASTKVNGVSPVSEVLPSCGSPLPGYTLPQNRPNTLNSASGSLFQPRSHVTTADYAAALFNGAPNSAFHSNLSPSLHTGLSAQLPSSRMHQTSSQLGNLGGSAATVPPHHLAHLVPPGQLPLGMHPKQQLQQQQQQQQQTPVTANSNSFLHQPFAAPGMNQSNHAAATGSGDQQGAGCYIGHMYPGGPTGHTYPNATGAVPPTSAVGSGPHQPTQPPAPIGAERRRQAALASTVSTVAATGSGTTSSSLQGSSSVNGLYSQPQQQTPTFAGNPLNPSPANAATNPMLMAFTMNLMQQQLQSQGSARVSGSSAGGHANWPLHHPALWSQGVNSGLANPSGSNQAQQQSLMANAAVAVAALANTGLWPPAAPSASGPGQLPGAVVSNAGGSGNWMLPSQPSVHSQYPPPRPMNSGASGSSSCMMSANAQTSSAGASNLLDEQ